MWIPKTEAEVRAALDSRELRETPSFDGKREIPRSLDLATDVAAMATDGGVLLIGVDEDDQKILSVATPIELASARERVDQMVQTNISEPPRVEIRSIECDHDPSRGYLVVVVPQSPRAPHMVTTRGHNRYYGRGATGNRILTEGEVARLYERRAGWQVDREALLQAEIDSSPLALNADLGYLHMVIRPVAPDDRLLARAISALDPSGADPRRALYRLLSTASGDEVLPAQFQGYPQFADARSHRWSRVESGYRLGVPPEYRQRTYNELQYGALEIQVDEDGTAHLLAGRAAERLPRDRGSVLVVFENSIAAHTVRFLWLAGRLYEASGYWGSADAGLAVTGIEGAGSHRLLDDFVHYGIVGESYRSADYRRTARFTVSDLRSNASGCAQALTTPLFETLTQERFDPYGRMLGGETTR
ncbi:MAG: ATP-binding protein [Chloroflexota bacterium]|nr:ATP-binding protein [Chloroflexota bacterium]